MYSATGSGKVSAAQIGQMRGANAPASRGFMTPAAAVRTPGLKMSADDWDCMPSDCSYDAEPELNTQSAFRPAFMAKMDRSWNVQESKNVDSILSSLNLDTYGSKRESVLREFIEFQEFRRQKYGTSTDFVPPTQSSKR